MSLISLLDQTIPESQKDEEWHILHATTYVSSSYDNNNNQKSEITKYFRAYQAELNDEERELTKSVTCPGGIDLGQEYIVYPLIQSKIEQIVGEFMLRPIRRKAYAIDKKSQDAKLKKKVAMVTEEIMRELSEDINKEAGFKTETENQNIDLPKDVEEFFEKSYKMISEEVADGLLRLFLDVNKEKNKFRSLFTDYAICDRAHAVLDKSKGHTTLRKVHPSDADYDLNPYEVVQKDHDSFFENYYLTENEIYNSFLELTNEQKKEVKNMFNQLSGNSGNDSSDVEQISYSDKFNGWTNNSNKTDRIRIVIAKWKSRKRNSFKVSPSSDGKRKFHKKLKEDYKPRKSDVIKHLDIEVPRFCVMIGPDICLDWGEMPERYTRVDAKWTCFLPVVSIVRDNTIGSSAIKSVAAKLYQLQQMASEILFELRLAMKSAGDSRALVYDAAQMPKAFASTGGLNRVFHHLKKDKLLVINTKDKGNERNTFNQFTSLDLSQKGGINDLMQGLAYIEDLASKFVGISPEREGQVHQNQTATGTNKALRGSYARTEIIFTPFDEFIQAILERAIMKMQHDYEEGQVIQYVFGDMKTKFMKIFKEFFSADLGVYLSDGRKDLEISEKINQATELAIQGTNTPEMMMGLIEVFEGESASEKKAVFARILKSLEEVRQQNQQAAQEQFKAEQEAESKAKEEEAQLTREGYQKDENVAHIYKDGKAQESLQKTASAEKIKAAELTVAQQEKNKEKE